MGQASRLGQHKPREENQSQNDNRLSLFGLRRQTAMAEDMYPGYMLYCNINLFGCQDGSEKWNGVDRF
jgi:hypothetical protein